MWTTSNQYCRQIIEIIGMHGVRTAYCSPGSRNAPLLIALEAQDAIRKHVVVDERSAAFQALGCGLVERRPVMLVCTSGTAVLNYAPAVAEAYYSGVPLIVLSADRPKEWIDQDDSQTIHQHGVLDAIVKASYDVRAIAEGSGREYTREALWTIDRTANEAMQKALEGKPGPVHINVQLADPLGAVEEALPTAYRKISRIGACETLSRSDLQTVLDITSGRKIMFVAGFMQPDNRLDRAVRKLGALGNVAIFAESISNLHSPQPKSMMVDSVLCDLSPEEKESLRPDVVISVGGALVSRMLKQYLREYPPQSHLSVGHANYFCDCFKSLTTRIDVEPAVFISQFSGALAKSDGFCRRSDYGSKWLAARSRAAEYAGRYIQAAPWSDLKAMDYLLRTFPADNLFVSNGTAIRYSQIIEHTFHAEYCNRGVSGIDGSTSTAVGGARAYNGKTTLLTGDMSWLYDSGASALADLPSDMRIVVFDNAGGGIFRFVRSTSSLPEQVLDRYFCVGDLPDISLIAGAYGIETYTADDMQSLEEGCAWLACGSGFPRLLLVRTPAGVSAEVLKGFFSKRNA